MIENLAIETVDWQQHKASLKAIREAVFIDEQHVPAHLEWDGGDSACTQFLASVGGHGKTTATGWTDRAHGGTQALPR